MTGCKGSVVLAAMMLVILLLSGCDIAEAPLATKGSSVAAERTPEYLVSHKRIYKEDKLYEELFYEYKNGKLVHRSYSFSPFTSKTVVDLFYDKAGQIIKEVETDYDRDGKKQNVETTVYEKSKESPNVLVYQVDAKGKKTLKHEELYDVWGNEIGTNQSHYLTIYDRYGTEIVDLTMGTVFNCGYQKLVPNVNAFYSEEGDLLRFSGCSDSNGFSLYENEFDDTGRIIVSNEWYASKVNTDKSIAIESHWEYDEDGSYVKTTITHYPPLDENLNPYDIQDTVYYAANHIPTKRFYTNLTAGKLMYEIIYDAEGDEESWLWYHDENAEPFYYHVKERDEHGNVLEDSLYDGDQLMVRTVYEYAVE